MPRPKGSKNKNLTVDEFAAQQKADMRAKLLERIKRPEPEAFKAHRAEAKVQHQEKITALREADDAHLKAETPADVPAVINPPPVEAVVSPQPSPVADTRDRPLIDDPTALALMRRFRCEQYGCWIEITPLGEGRNVLVHTDGTVSATMTLDTVVDIYDRPLMTHLQTYIQSLHGEASDAA